MFGQARGKADKYTAYNTGTEKTPKASAGDWTPEVQNLDIVYCHFLLVVGPEYGVPLDLTTSTGLRLFGGWV